VRGIRSATVDEIVKIKAETLLRDSPECNVGLALPFPISDRLDELVSIAESNGERTNRKEVIAALILNAAASGNFLSNVLKIFRTTSAGDALVGKGSGVKKRTISRSPRPPGPRTRSRPTE